MATWIDDPTKYRVWDYKDGEPPCLCGCGLPVSKLRQGRVRNYRRGHHPNISITEAFQARAEASIPIEPFRKAINDIRREKNLQIKDMMEILGYSRGHLSSLLYYKERKTIKKETAAHILRRLAGMPTKPTSYERQRIERLELSYKEISRDFHV